MILPIGIVFFAILGIAWTWEGSLEIVALCLIGEWMLVGFYVILKELKKHHD